MSTPTTAEPSEADLRALAERADAGESLNLQEPASTQGADAATATTQTEGTQTDTQQTGAALPPGNQPQQQADAQKQQTQQPPQKPESEWARMQREKEELRQEKIRLARTWQQVQAEKARLRTPAINSTPAPHGADGPLAKASLEDLQDLADDYAREGNTRLEARVREEIARRRQAPQQSQPAQAQPHAQPQIDRDQFLAEWNVHLAELQASDPEFAKPDAPLRREVSEVLQHPYFSGKPDGIREAYQLAKLRLEARAAPELRKRVTQLETEIKTLRAATAPGGGGPESRGAAAKPFDQMSDAEQVEFLKRQAAEADAFR